MDINSKSNICLLPKSSSSLNISSDQPSGYVINDFQQLFENRCGGSISCSLTQASDCQSPYTDTKYVEEQWFPYKVKYVKDGTGDGRACYVCRHENFERLKNTRMAEEKGNEKETEVADVKNMNEML